MKPDSDWTGERLEKYILNETTIEHLHRYGAVLCLLKDKDVLDIACGEGYGANIMADYAKTVIGVDIAETIIVKAKSNYIKNNLSYMQGSVESMPISDSSIDIVVSFETLEHHEKHEEMLGEIKRVLRPNGLLIISTPDKSTNDQRIGYKNIYHFKELYLDEFKELISKYFCHANYYFQKVIMGSMLIAENNSKGFLHLAGCYDRIKDNIGLPNHNFNICVASDGAVPELETSFFDGRTILETNMKDNMKASKYYRFGYIVLYPLTFIRNIIRKH